MDFADWQSENSIPKRQRKGQQQQMPKPRLGLIMP